MKRFPWPAIDFGGSSFADRVVAILLTVIAAGIGVVLLISFGLMVLIGFILAVKLVIGFMIYRWWVQRSERRSSAENFRPRATEGGPYPSSERERDALEVVAIELQVNSDQKKN